MESAKETVLTKFVVGVTQIVDALGDPNVKSETILSGLKQVTDGLGLAGSASDGAASGANTIGHVLARTVANQDITTALHQAGLARAGSYTGLGDEGGTAHRTLIVLRQGGVA